MVRDLESLLDEARASAIEVIGGQPGALGFVTNATTAVNAVAWSLRLEAGDELLVTGHVYNACHNALVRVAQRAGAKVVVAELPLPCLDEDSLVQAVLAKVNSRTKFGLIDQITSPTAIVLPVKRICAELAARGVQTMVDAAHVPGQMAVDVDEVGAHWWTGNFHKWLVTPKGSAVLHARDDVRDATLPLLTSHAFNSQRGDRSRFLQGFDWPGTWDPTAVLCLPAALRFLRALDDGGVTGLMARNRRLCRAAAEVIEGRAGLQPVAPVELRAAMCAFWLQPGPRAVASRCSEVLPVQDLLHERYQIEVPVVAAPGHETMQLLRVSCHAYNDLTQYERLADAICELREDQYVL